MLFVRLEKNVTQFQTLRVYILGSRKQIKITKSQWT